MLSRPSCAKNRSDRHFSRLLLVLEEVDEEDDVVTLPPLLLLLDEDVVLLFDDDDDNGGVLPSVPGTIKSRGTKSSGSGPKIVAMVPTIIKPAISK